MDPRAPGMHGKGMKEPRSAGALSGFKEPKTKGLSHEMSIFSSAQGGLEMGRDGHHSVAKLAIWIDVTRKEKGPRGQIPRWPLDRRVEIRAGAPPPRRGPRGRTDQWQAEIAPFNPAESGARTVRYFSRARFICLPRRRINRARGESRNTSSPERMAVLEKMLFAETLGSQRVDVNTPMTAPTTGWLFPPAIVTQKTFDAGDAIRMTACSVVVVIQALREPVWPLVMRAMLTTRVESCESATPRDAESQASTDSDVIPRRACEAAPLSVLSPVLEVRWLTVADQGGDLTGATLARSFGRIVGVSVPSRSSSRTAGAGSNMAPVISCLLAPGADLPSSLPRDVVAVRARRVAGQRPVSRRNSGIATAGETAGDDATSLVLVTRHAAQTGTASLRGLASQRRKSRRRVETRGNAWRGKQG
ncbi:hypothetical protein CMUS01_08924 [Colletotrichum musicola]|uniref:Uncharacterized protein n=1 Tax=Colletotrichum musicola TaxID=2175873 RepID=A0A8H6K9T4_9PEZI|nr:hypothetical protein CMUS01_08924 [Colletotrichum musicola]